jgi:transcriptional regulator with XRE-family HTH domain
MRSYAGRVDNRTEIREFLGTRRARITPQQAGLSAYGGNRCVPGLRSEEVAMLAGVSVDYYVRLERGSLTGASDSVLEGLARALQVDNVSQRPITSTMVEPVTGAWYLLRVLAYTGQADIRAYAPISNTGSHMSQSLSTLAPPMTGHSGDRSPLHVAAGQRGKWQRCNYHR